MLRLKILSNGTAIGTRVVMPDGRELPGVTKVEWSISAKDRFATAVIHVAGVELDAKADAEVLDAAAG